MATMPIYGKKKHLKIFFSKTKKTWSLWSLFKWWFRINLDLFTAWSNLCPGFSAILEECCRALADMQWSFYSSERIMAFGPLVFRKVWTKAPNKSGICVTSANGFFNLYHSLGIFSRRQNDVIFLIFPRKQDLTFHANCLLRRQFAWNVKSCFLGKIRKIFQNVVCWKFYPEC